MIIGRASSWGEKPLSCCLKRRSFAQRWANRSSWPACGGTCLLSWLLNVPMSAAPRSARWRRELRTWPSGFTQPYFTSSIEYSEEWLLGASGNVLLDPGLFLYRGRQHTPLDQRMFALLPWTTLRTLESATLALEADRDGMLEIWLNLLLAPGSSLGGARPKAAVQGEDGPLWIAKFPSRKDSIDTGFVVTPRFPNGTNHMLHTPSIQAIDVYPLIPAIVIPCTKCFCAARNTMQIGSTVIVDAAIIRST